MKAPTNTANEITSNPLSFLVEQAFTGRAVENQEKRGQSEFVESDTLPAQIRAEDLDLLTSAGVKFLGPVDGDDLFQFVKLPAGWRKEPTDHSMWSHLVDDKGRIRGAIFYKAAFYDRSSNMHMQARYQVSVSYESQDSRVAYAKDGDRVLYTSPVFAVDKERLWVASGDAQDDAMAWLDREFPEWRDPGKYWD
jgi:deoxyxylulose-5-phosphate synthase